MSDGEPGRMTAFRLSFPNICGWIGFVRQNHRIIRADGCNPALAWKCFVAGLLKSRCRLEAENLFHRHQLGIALRRAPPRLRLSGVLLLERWQRVT
jgi:hypothetical protein